MGGISAPTGPLAEARDAYRRRDWTRAREWFARADDEHDLDADDLYAFANCSWWLGDLDTALPRMQRAYQRYLDDDQAGQAALVAIDVGYTYSLRGEDAQGSGWIGRASRLLGDRPDLVEHGYLVHLEFEAAFGRGDLDGAMDAAGRVHAHGQRFRDATLSALGVVGQGRVLMRRGEVEAGTSLLDEAMLAALSDDLDPGWAGNIYCHLMIACYEIADLRRAGEWTEATARWCESMPGAGPFLGICRVHRAQILQVRGAWDVAQREVEHVVAGMSTFDMSIVAEAHYLLGDLRRQRGDLDDADAAYREANRLGRDPQPGRALAHLARGDIDGADAAIRAALAAAGVDVVARSRLLPAAVEVAVAAGDVQQASAWTEELADAARTYGTTGFAAAAMQARGAVALAAGEPEAAVAVLRDALRASQELDAPYETARVRRLLAQAYDTLGDRAAAGLERAAAKEAFAELGVAEPTGAATGARGARRAVIPAGLTRREVEVLALVAAGRSNQEIADELVLSVRTVERHLATVYQKLGLHGRSARAGAVSFALREGILATS